MEHEDRREVWCGLHGAYDVLGECPGCARVREWAGSPRVGVELGPSYLQGLASGAGAERAASDRLRTRVAELEVANRQLRDEVALHERVAAGLDRENRELKRRVADLGAGERGG